MAHPGPPLESPLNAKHIGSDETSTGNKLAVLEAIGLEDLGFPAVSIVCFARSYVIMKRK